MSLPRPRIGLLVALVATLVLLCCGGTVSAILIGGLGSDDKSNTYSGLGCGQGGPIDPEGDLPGIADYRPEQIRNAAIIINVGSELKLPPRAWVIAVATAMQESRLNNLGHLGGRDAVSQQGADNGAGAGPHINVEVVGVVAKQAFVEGQQRADLVSGTDHAAAGQHQSGLAVRRGVAIVRVKVVFRIQSCSLMVIVTMALTGQARNP